MKKSTLLFSLLAGMMAMPAMASAADAGFMSPATLSYPATTYVGKYLSSVDLTWDNQPIELIDPEITDYDEEVVYVDVAFGDNAPVKVSAALLYSEGFFPGEEDVYYLSVGLYEIKLSPYVGEDMVISIPEGVVKNQEGLLNPAQEIEFKICETIAGEAFAYGYPEEDYLLTGPDAFVYYQFKDSLSDEEVTAEGLKYNGGNVTVSTYFPEYKSFTLNFGKEVTILNDYTLQLDLNSLPSGEYEIIIPEGMLTVNWNGESFINDAYYGYFEVDNTSAVKTIEVTRSDSRIYNLNGVMVGDAKSADTFPKGVYVVNGKKFIIK